MKSAPPMAPPGWPELAFSTIDAASMRILSAALIIRFLSFIFFYYKIVFDNVFIYRIEDFISRLIQRLTWRESQP